MTQMFAAIDLKSFYASVECRERKLDPLTTNLVVADETRTDKTICLAISPSLKSYGLPGRARLFEVKQKVREINQARLKHAPLGIFLGESSDLNELNQNPNLALGFIIAPPRMQYYLEYSQKIYNIYLQFVAPEDIFAYSIDEIFCDLTNYLKLTKTSAEEFVSKMIAKVYAETGITATAGIGTNLYLAKVAMDILAKHAEPNAANVRLALLDEMTYRQKLWAHTPITDFWRVGRGYAKRLADQQLYTMGDIARCSIHNEKILYDLFGVNAELLIDHAWGYECVNISDVKNHRPETRSLSSGQVLSAPYPFARARNIVKEMAEEISLELFQKNLVTDHLTLTISYDHQSSAPPSQKVLDHYGRSVPKPAQGRFQFSTPTASTRLITNGLLKIFDDRANRNYAIRKITISADNLVDKSSYQSPKSHLQISLFTNPTDLIAKLNRERRRLRREERVQTAILKIRSRYGKNAILRGINFEDGATMRSRHQQIGGHQA